MSPTELVEAGALRRHVEALAAAPSPSALFGALAEAAPLASARSGILLLRHGRLRGWGSAASHGIDITADSGWAATALVSVEPVPLPESPLARAGEPAARACVAFPVRAGGRALALLVAEQHAAAPWIPQALALLVSVATLRLELDLARRRLAPQESPIAVPPPPPPVSAAPPPARPAPPEPTALAPAEAPGPRGPADARRDEARRFARLIATDIRLYNEEAVVLGRRQGDLLRRLQDPIARGREAFVRRFADLGDDGLRLLHESCVQVLAGGDDALLPFHTLRPARP